MNKGAFATQRTLQSQNLNWKNACQIDLHCLWKRPRQCLLEIEGTQFMVGSEEPPFEAPCCRLVGTDKQSNPYAKSKTNAKPNPNTDSHTSIEPRQFTIFTIYVFCSPPIHVTVVIFIFWFVRSVFCNLQFNKPKQSVDQDSQKYFTKSIQTILGRQDHKRLITLRESLESQQDLL